MEKPVIKQTIIFLILLATSLLANAQPKNVAPRLVKNPLGENLKKLMSIALDPKDNGLKLVDTSSGYLLNSTIQFPNVGVAKIMRRSAVYQQKDIANLSYDWYTTIATINQKDTLQTNKTLGILQQTIAQVMPKVRDSFYINNSYGSYMTWVWKPKKGVILKLYYDLNDKDKIRTEVVLSLDVHKFIPQSQIKITDSLIKTYTGYSLAANSVKASGNYFRSLVKILEQEGLSTNEIITKLKVPFKTIASQNMDFAAEIIFVSPQNFFNLLKAELTPEQLASFQKTAKKISDDFDAKYYGKKTATQQNQTATAPPKPQKQIYNLYYTNDPNPGPNSKYVYINYQDVDGQYNIRDIAFIPKKGKDKWRVMAIGPDKVVSSLHFTSLGGYWKAVNIRDCFICYGTGTETRQTPYTYYYEEKGIYNKYTYSGSGYNTTSKFCTSCNGGGYKISLMQ